MAVGLACRSPGGQRGVVGGSGGREDATVLAHEGQPLETDTLQVEVECGFVRQPWSEDGQAAPSEEVAQRADVLRRAGETMDQQTADVAAFEEEGAGSRHYTHASLPCDPVVYAREFPCALRTPRIDDAYANAPSPPRQPRAIEPCVARARLDCTTGLCRPETRGRGARCGLPPVRCRFQQRLILMALSA